MVAFRKALESRWCVDFKTYMRRHRPSEMHLWEARRPDVPKLLALFSEYLQHAGQGITAPHRHGERRAEAPSNSEPRS